MDIPNQGISGLANKRHLMPQVVSRDYDEFFKWLKDNHGISHYYKRLNTRDLFPTQGEFNAEKVDGLVKKRSPKMNIPILVSKDMKILDGHHRWLANHQVSGKTNAIVFDVGGKDFIDIAKKFPKAIVKKINESKNDKKEKDSKEKSKDKKNFLEFKKKAKQKILINPENDEYESYAK